MKYLLVILVVAVVVWVLRAAARRARDDRAGTRSPPARGVPESMLSCAHCGTHLPAGEALLGQGRAYCCEAHRLAGPR